MGRKKQYKLINEKGLIYKTTIKPTIQGHRSLRIYCKPSCPSAKKYWEGWGKSLVKKEKVFFANEEIAIKAGYSPCKICH